MKRGRKREAPGTPTPVVVPRAEKDPGAPPRPRVAGSLQAPARSEDGSAGPLGHGPRSLSSGPSQDGKGRVARGVSPSPRKSLRRRSVPRALRRRGQASPESPERGGAKPPPRKGHSSKGAYTAPATRASQRELPREGPRGTPQPLGLETRGTSSPKGAEGATCCRVHSTRRPLSH